MDVAPRTAIRRPRRRTRERGAAVFIVVMVISLLTAIGIFAARSASLVDVAAGHERQMLQTEYLSQYGTLAAAAELGSGAADVHINRLRAGLETDDGSEKYPDCRATDKLKQHVERSAGVQKVPCHRISSAGLGRRLSQNPEAAALLEPATDDGDHIVPGSLGILPLSGSFVVEITEPGQIQKPIPGESAGGAPKFLEYASITLSTYGQLHKGDNACTEATTASAALQSVRAHAVIGPYAP